MPDDLPAEPAPGPNIVDQWKATKGSKTAASPEGQSVPPKKRTGLKVLATILWWPAGVFAFIMAATRKWAWFKTYFITAGITFGLFLAVAIMGGMLGGEAPLPNCGGG